jgi:hypothetical protein
MKVLYNQKMIQAALLMTSKTLVFSNVLIGDTVIIEIGELQKRMMHMTNLDIWMFKPLHSL